MLCSISDKRNQQSMLHLLLGLKPPKRFKTTKKTKQIPTAAAEAQSETCKLSADWTPPTKPSSYCWVREEQRGIQEAASPSGGSQRKKKRRMRRKSTNLHPKLLLRALPVSARASLRLQALRELFSWRQKNSRTGSSSTVSTCKGVWWGERVVALALKKPAIAPPGKKQRDYRGGGEEKTVSVFPPTHLSGDRPAGGSQMSACYVSQDGEPTRHVPPHACPHQMSARMC